MAVPAAEEMQAALACPLCAEQYSCEARHPQCPKSLTCGHTACATCLRRLSPAGESTICPFCRRAFAEEEITTNFALMQCVETLDGLSLQPAPAEAPAPAHAFIEAIATCDAKLEELRAKFPGTEGQLECYVHTIQSLRQRLEPEQLLYRLHLTLAQVLKKTMSPADEILLIQDMISKLRNRLPAQDRLRDVQAEVAALRALIAPKAVLSQAKKEVAFLKKQLAKLEKERQMREAELQRALTLPMCRFFPNCRFSAVRCKYYHGLCEDYNMGRCLNDENNCQYEHTLVIV